MRSLVFSRLWPNPGIIPALHRIGPLGFDGIKFLILYPEDLVHYWVEPRLTAIKNLLAKYQLAVSGITLFGPKA